MKKLAIAWVEDDADIREAYLLFFATCSEFEVVFSYSSVEELEIAIHQGVVWDVVLMDIQLPGKSGIEGIKLLKQKFKDIDVIMLTIYNDEHQIFESLCAGATGYLLKNTPFADIRNGILSVHRGGAPMSPQIARKVLHFFNQPVLKNQYKTDLSDREKQIISGLVDGLSYKLIAAKCFISIDTVRFHIKNIYRKLHVNSKGEVIAKAVKGQI
jgi:DNA-binding NarL/FixJ family response regulator